MNSLTADTSDYTTLGLAEEPSQRIDTSDDLAVLIMPVNIDEALKQQSYLDFALDLILSGSIIVDESWEPFPHLPTADFEVQNDQPLLGAATALESSCSSINKLLLSGGNGVRSPPAWQTTNYHFADIPHSHTLSPKIIPSLLDSYEPNKR